MNTFALSRDFGKYKTAKDHFSSYRIRRRRLAPTMKELQSGKTKEFTAHAASSLVQAWGNTIYSATVDYLLAVAAYARVAPGPAVECGSGLTTLVLGLYASHGTWTLEHNPLWRWELESHVRRYDLDVEVLKAPLRSYSDFDWYDLPRGLPSNVGLIVCDGPPGSTRGGRYGALPVLWDRLQSGTTLLLDDAGRKGEQQALYRWSREWGARVEEHQFSDRSLAIVTCP